MGQLYARHGDDRHLQLPDQRSRLLRRQRRRAQSIRGDERHAEAGRADAFALFAEAANIAFVEVAPGTASINLATANLGAGIGGWAYYPYPGYSGPGDQTVMGDVWIINRYASYSNPTKGSWEYLTIIHEIGHAIGLKHPGNYNAGGGGTGGPYLPTSEDSHQYTVMSYYSGPSYGSTEPITPQLYEIAAVKHLEHFPNWRNWKGIPLRGQIMIHPKGW